MAAEPEESGFTELSSVPSRDPRAEDKLQVGLTLPPGAPGAGGSANVASEPPDGFWGDPVNSFTTRCVVLSPRM